MSRQHLNYSSGKLIHKTWHGHMGYIQYQIYSSGNKAWSDTFSWIIGGPTKIRLDKGSEYYIITINVDSSDILV